MTKAILASIIIWPTFFIFRLVVILLGYIMVPIALLFKAYYTTRNKYGGNNGDPIYLFYWRIMEPWQNYSDGFYCTTYYDYGFFWTSVHWSCVRNPASGLRWLPYYTCKINPEKLRYIGTYSKAEILKYKNKKEPHYWVCWQGPYLSILWQFYIFGQLRRLWIGHKLDPRDVFGLLPDDYRVDGAAFTSQFKPLN
jgi:hypothetical protein